MSFVAASACDYGSIFTQKHAVFWVAVGGGIQGRGFTALVFSLKEGSCGIPALARTAISKDRGWTLPCPAEQEDLLFKMSANPQQKAAKVSDVVPIPEFPCQRPLFYNRPSDTLLSALLLCATPRQRGQCHKKPCILSRATLLGHHVQELSQPLQDRISLLLATWLPVCRQHCALAHFNEIQKKKNNFFLFLFNISVYFCQFWAFGLSLV